VPVGVGRVVAQCFEQFDPTGQDLGQQAAGGVGQVGHVRSGEGVPDGATVAGRGHDARAAQHRELL
jgi:hypothetical protein